MATATKRGIYVLDGRRYRFLPGQVIPKGAQIEGESEAADEAPKAVKKADQPKWYQNYREKHPDAPALMEGDTEATYKERVAQTGREETTDGQAGPSETT
jgi:hypothetical protein